MPSDYASFSDEDLYRKFAASDKAAFEELLIRHQEQVYRLACRIVGNSEEARDIAEEVFINLWENPSSYKPTAKFSTWLYRVTSNRSISHLRIRRFKSLFSFSENDSSDIFSDDPAERPDVMAEKSDDRERIARAMMNLPPRQRAAIHLRYREEMSVAEVAEVLNLSLKSVESLLFRGKQYLRKVLKKQE